VKNATTKWLHHALLFNSPEYFHFILERNNYPSHYIFTDHWCYYVYTL